jgi:hypothetical protein
MGKILWFPTLTAVGLLAAPAGLNAEARESADSHDGAWSAGIDGARVGLRLPGRPRLYEKHYPDIAPGVAMTRAEVVELGVTVATRVREFKVCLHTIETTPFKRGQTVHKWYAPGIGLVQRDDLTLVQFGQLI